MARSNKKALGKTSHEKRDAVEAVLMMAAPSPNKSAKAPSMQKCTQLLGIPMSTFYRSGKSVMDKQARQLAEEKRIYSWAQCKRKKGYSDGVSCCGIAQRAAFISRRH